MPDAPRAGLEPDPAVERRRQVPPRPRQPRELRRLAAPQPFGAGRRAPRRRPAWTSARRAAARPCRRGPRIPGGRGARSRDRSPPAPAPPGTRARRGRAPAPRAGGRQTRSPSARAPSSEQPHLDRQPPARGPRTPGEQAVPPAAARRRARPPGRSATRSPAPARSRTSPCTCTPRTRTEAPLGRAVSSSPGRTSPQCAVPVTTVPDPAIVNTRSTAIRNGRCGSSLALDAARARQHRVAHGSDPAAPEHRARDHRGAGERPPFQVALDLVPAHLEQLPLHEIRLRERDHAAPHPEHLEDAQVLAGLRHHPFVGGHDQQRAVDPRRPGDHGVHETLVPGDVDERELDLPRRVRERREPEHERDAAPLLLGQAVAVDAGQGLDQRGLAVVDVTGGAEDDGAHAPILAGRRWSCWSRR